MDLLSPEQVRAMTEKQFLNYLLAVIQTSEASDNVATQKS